MAHEPTYVPIGILSDRTGLPVKWLDEQAKLNLIPSLTIGRRRLFNVAAVQHALAAAAGAPKAVSGAATSQVGVMPGSRST